MYSYFMVYRIQNTELELKAEEMAAGRDYSASEVLYHSRCHTHTQTHTNTNTHTHTHTRTQTHYVCLGVGVGAGVCDSSASIFCIDLT